MSEPTQDLLPLYETSRGFDTAMRGYDRAQVDREITRLDDDLRAMAAERDSAAARSADLAAQLASVQAQIESLRRQLRVANEMVTTDNVDQRVSQKLDAAAVMAARLRAEAEDGAEQIRNGAADAAARTRSAAQAEAERIVGAATERLAEAERTFRQRIAQTEAHKGEVEMALARSEQQAREDEARLSADAEALRNRLDAERERLDAESAAERERLDAESAAERERLNAESAAERERLDTDSAAERERLESESAAEIRRLEAESLAARTLAQEDFEITWRLRRSQAQRDHAEQKRTADDDATRTVADARAQANQVIADATHEVRRLHEVRNALHADLTALQGRVATALTRSLAATPDEPALSASVAGTSRPLPGADDETLALEPGPNG